MWWVGPSTEPRNLGKYLEDSGLDHAGELSGMAIDLDALLAHLSPPPELSIDPVRDEETLKVWLSALATGYELPDAAVRGLFDYFRSSGFGPDAPVRNYLGRWKGQPVASSSLFFGGGVAGVYVTVVPEFRKQGIGAAMTLVPLRVARAAGYRVGITHVPDYRLGFHRKLGFKPYCTFSTYVLRSPARLA
jgi:GNAT superfamily N-acetyltransferase